MVGFTYGKSNNHSTIVHYSPSTLKSSMLLRSSCPSFFTCLFEAPKCSQWYDLLLHWGYYSPFKHIIKLVHLVYGVVLSFQLLDNMILQNRNRFFGCSAQCWEQKITGKQRYPSSLGRENWNITYKYITRKFR